MNDGRGAVLSDRTIGEEIERGHIVVAPLAEGAIQPASVDLRLGAIVRVFAQHREGHIDVRTRTDHLTERVDLDDKTPFYLHPGEFALGMTLETVELPDDIVGRLDGKSSLGRLGLVVHSTAGFVDPGWKGNLTLELSNLSPLPISLFPGMKVSQISFMWLTTPADRPYGSANLGSKYQGQQEPTPSRFYQNFPQGSLLSLRGDPAGGERAARGRARPASLLEWLAASDFRGEVASFALALGVPVRTVEGWVHRGVEPGRKHQGALHRVTRLPQYRGDGDAVQPALPEGGRDA